MEEIILKILKENRVTDDYDRNVIWADDIDLTDLAKSIEQAMNYTRSCMSDSEQLPLDNFCKVCNLPTDGEKCYYKRCPV